MMPAMIPDHSEAFTPVYAALGKAINRWGLVEHALARCYAVCLGGDEAVGRAQFWKSSGFAAAAIRATDKLVRRRVVGERVLLPRWNHLAGHLGSLAARRHELAHGSVGIWHGRPAITAASSLRRHLTPIRLRWSFTWAEIEATIDEFSEMADQLMAFARATDAMPPPAAR